MSDGLNRPSLFEQIRLMWGRHYRIAFLAFAPPITAAVGIAFFLPKLYKSTATVVVERRGSDTSAYPDVDARFRALNAENISRTHLTDVIRRFNLYREMRRRAPAEEILDQMRRDVRLDVVEREQAGLRIITAVNVTYTGLSPQTAADVANALASYYEAEDLRLRELRVRETREKFKAQLATARERLDHHEQRLREYKERHLRELPEQVSAHLAQLGRLNEQIRSSLDRRESAVAKPVVAPAGELDQRLSQLRDLKARYTDEHPDVARVKREIELLPEKGSASGADGQPSSLAQLQQVRMEVEQLQRTAAGYEQQIMNAPKRQQELEALLPDYVAARTQYQTMLEKYETAQLADPRSEGDRLRVMEPAMPRDLPVGPNVLRLVALGTALSLGAMVGAVALIERLDTSFHTLEDLRAFTKLPVLASLPRIVTQEERRRSRRRDLQVAGLTLLLVVIVFAGSAYWASGNELLVWKLVNRKG